MSNIVLKEENQIQSYFSRILELKTSGEKFPIDLDDVWSLCYSQKVKATEALTSDFIENEDYIVFSQKVENSKGGRPKRKYMLSVQCLEYFIVKKVRPVFEVYRKVFHKSVETLSIPTAAYATIDEVSKLRKDIEILQTRFNNQSFAIAYSTQIETEHSPISRKEVLSLAEGLADMMGVSRGECLSRLYRAFHKVHGINVYSSKNEMESNIEFCERKGYLGLLKEIIKEQMDYITQ